MSLPTKSSKPVEIFYSYSHKDEKLRNRLETHLSLLKQQGLVINWHDRMISAGKEWQKEINHYLNSSHIILLLISPDFLASGFCYSIEMKRAVERHERGEARVIPIILRPVYWENAPFSMLEALPKDGKAITTWTNRDEAFLDVTKGIQKAIKELQVSVTSFVSQEIKQETSEEIANIPQQQIKTYYVFEDEPMQYAKIHFSTCHFCNNGKGFQPRAGGVYSKWHGPFDTMQRAKDAAYKTGKKIEKCKICNPS